MMLKNKFLLSKTISIKLKNSQPYLFWQTNTNKIKHTMAGENGRFMLQNLPFMILKNIFSYFPYVSMFKFSKLCILFREVAVHRMRLGFAKLLPIIQSKCAYFNGKCEHLFSSMLKGEIYESYEYKKMLKISMSMKVLLSEVQVMHAVSGRYENDPKWNYFCAYSGQVLDAIYKLIALSYFDDDRSYKFVTFILEDIDKFLYHFLSHVVPELNTNVPFGVQVVDILSCLRNSNVKGTATVKYNGTLLLKERYRFNKMSYLMYPFDIDKCPTIDKKLNYILFMLSVNVRYHNFCYFFKEQSTMEGLVVGARWQHLLELRNGRGQNYLKRMQTENKYRNVSHHNVAWRQISPNEYSREIKLDTPFVKGRLSFKCKLKLTINDPHYPLNMPEVSLTAHLPSTPHHTATYDFWLDVRMNYLSQIEYAVKKAQIKIRSLEFGGHELIIK
ncbi:uncharacterized protein isoform X2 [Rhodnius prolixus]|uniref:uncharacterized protein isoform X2 n=1 Tax=Rhodnius prolixus TaxID=13249 RepID=UPI003D18F6A3